MECLHLRVGDLEERLHAIRVFAGKGGKDRMSVLPDHLVVPLKVQINHVRSLHKKQGFLNE